MTLAASNGGGSDTPIREQRPLAIVVCIIAYGTVLSFVGQYFLPEQMVTRAYARVIAPVLGYFYGEGQRHQLAVVLIDEERLAQAGETWPAKYEFHSRLLKTVAKYKPKAIFLDVHFSRSRPDSTLTELQDTLCSLAADGLNVFIGVTDRTDYRLRGGLEGLQDHFGRPCLTKVAIVATPDKLDPVLWTYPFRLTQSDAVTVPSAAVGIYDYLTRQRGGRTSDHEFHHEMSLTWGLHSVVQAEGVNWVRGGGRQHYCDDRGSFLDRRPPCVFHQTLYASDLVAGTESEEEKSSQLLRCRVVLIGTDLPLDPDLVDSPIHGRVPGVYAHAMALDNLLTYGSAAKVSVHLGFAGALEWKAVFLLWSSLAAIGLVSWAFYARVSPWATRFGKEERKRLVALHLPIAVPLWLILLGVRGVARIVGATSNCANGTRLRRRLWSTALDMASAPTYWIIVKIGYLFTAGICSAVVILLGHVVFNLGVLTVAHFSALALFVEVFEGSEHIHRWWHRAIVWITAIVGGER